MLYNDFKSQVICNTAVTAVFSVTTYVKRGCILSDYLFILAIDSVLKQLTEEWLDEHWPVSWQTWIMLMILCCSLSDTKACRKRLIPWHLQQGAWVLRSAQENRDTWGWIGEVVGEVDYFTYLGSKVSTSLDWEEKIQVWISKASQAYAVLCGLGDPRTSRILRSDSSKAIF